MGSLRETNPSLWVGTTAESRFPTLSGDVEADVAVIGGGIAGLMTAALCRQDGHRVALLEAGRLAAGATGYTTAKLTALHGLVYDQLARSFGDSAAAQYADANLAGMAKVAALVDRHGIDCDFERQPAFTYTTDAGTVDKVQAEVATAERIGLGATFTTETGLPYPVAGAVRLDDQAQFHPRRYCLALADTIPGEGSHVFELSQAVEVHDADPCVGRVRGLHPHGLHGHLEHRRDHVGLPLPRLTLHRRRRGPRRAGPPAPRTQGPLTQASRTPAGPSTTRPTGTNPAAASPASPACSGATAASRPPDVWGSKHRFSSALSAPPASTLSPR